MFQISARIRENMMVKLMIIVSLNSRCLVIGKEHYYNIMPTHVST